MGNYVYVPIKYIYGGKPFILPIDTNMQYGLFLNLICDPRNVRHWYLLNVDMQHWILLIHKSNSLSVLWENP